MNEDRNKIWAELQARAERLLEHAKEVEPRDIVRTYPSQLRLWHYPAFGPLVTWTILSAGKKSAPESSPLVREITWDQLTDGRRFFGPGEVPSASLVSQPTIRLREAPLPESSLARIMQDGADLAVPLINVSGFPPGMAAADGERWGLENYEFSPRIHIDWFGDGPQVWRHFIDWFGTLRFFLCACLDEAGW